MRLPPDWRGAAKLVFAFRDMYEPELEFVELFLNPGMTFVDAGASLGIYTLCAAACVGPTGRVFAFEPTATSFGALTANIAINQLENVHAFHLALFDKRQTLWLGHHPDASRNAVALARAGGAVAVKADRLDEVLRDNQVGRVHLIKMDIEGAEEAALRGSEEVIARDRPVILFENNAIAQEQLGLSRAGPWGLLAGKGYRFFEYVGSGSLRALSVAPSFGNPIAIHESSIGEYLRQQGETFILARRFGR